MGKKPSELMEFAAEIKARAIDYGRDMRIRLLEQGIDALACGASKTVKDPRAYRDLLRLFLRFIREVDIKDKANDDLIIDLFIDRVNEKGGV